MLSSNKQRVVDRRSPLKLECKEDLKGEGIRGKRIPERVETIFFFFLFVSLFLPSRVCYLGRGERDQDLEAVLQSLGGTTPGET